MRYLIDFSYSGLHYNPVVSKSSSNTFIEGVNYWSENVKCGPFNEVQNRERITEGADYSVLLKTFGDISEFLNIRNLIFSYGPKVSSLAPSNSFTNLKVTIYTDKDYDIGDIYEGMQSLEVYEYYTSYSDEKIYSDLNIDPTRYFGSNCSEIGKDNFPWGNMFKKDGSLNKITTSSFAVSCGDNFVNVNLRFILHDDVNPEIEKLDTFKQEYSIGNTISSVNLASYFSVSDDYDVNPTLSFKLDGSNLTSKTFKASDVGVHQLVVTAVDSSGNDSSLTFNIEVLDENAPVISRKDASEGVIKIGLSKVLNLTEKEFCQLFEATDDVDGDVSDTLAINGDFIDNHVGTYTVKLQAHDDSGNFASLTVEVEVLADVPPVFILGDALVLASTDNPLSSSQIEKVIINGLASDYDITTLYYDAESYLATPTEVGDYIVTYSYDYLNEEGVEESSTGKSFTLRVQGDQVDDNEEEELDWWSAFCKWWIDGFQCLWNWLCGRGWYTNAELGLE